MENNDPKVIAHYRCCGCKAIIDIPFKKVPTIFVCNKCDHVENFMVENFMEVIGIDTKAEPEDILNGPEATKMRIKQLEINCKFLTDAIDIIYHSLCTGPGGTWQDRVRLAVEASMKLKK